MGTLIDDTIAPQKDSETSNRPEIQFSRDVNTIMESRFFRQDAWESTKNWKFLTYDAPPDPVADKRNYGIIHGQCQPCSRKLPTPSGHVCLAHFDFISDEDSLQRDKARKLYEDPCVHVKENTCKECKSIPPFPKEGPISKFRIRTLPAPFKTCNHFVAVSYCMSEENQSGSSYDVYEEDGSLRKTRASTEVIDRVVSFARENGFRMIWIADECIGSNKEREKEMIIQAMERMFARAKITIGLVTARLEQKHLESLFLAHEHKMGGNLLKRNYSPIPPDTIKDHSPEILLETVSMIVNDRWNTRAWTFHEAHLAPRKMILLFPRLPGTKVEGWFYICHELSYSDIAIDIRVVDAYFHFARPTLNNHFWKPAEEASALTKEARTTKWRFEFFTIPGKERKPCFNFGKHKRYGLCNAAVALSYIKHRDISRPADKLALIANMCAYQVRLDTHKLDRSLESLATCVFGLAILNSDFSLFACQVYRQPDPPAENLGIAKNSLDFSWAQGCVRSMHKIATVGHACNGGWSHEFALSVRELSEDGMHLLGILWKRHGFIGLPDIQAKYARPVRQNASTEDTTRPKTIDVLIDVLVTLWEKKEYEVADAIFNSTSRISLTVPGEEWNRCTTMESFADIYPHLQKVDRETIFTLAPKQGGGFHEDWIVDRIIGDGGLWKWEAAAPSKGVLIYPSEQPSTTSAPKPPHYEGGFSHHNKSESYKERVIHPHYATITNAPLDGHAADSPCVMGQILAEILRGEKAPEPSKFEVPPKTVGDVVFHFAHSPADDIWGRQAVFNTGIDTPPDTMILTPFSTSLESVPRPDLRAMNVSWFVDTYKTPADPANEGAEGPLTVSSTVQGMWRYTVRHSAKFIVK